MRGALILFRRLFGRLIDEAIGPFANDLLVNTNFFAKPDRECFETCNCFNRNGRSERRRLFAECPF